MSERNQLRPTLRSRVTGGFTIAAFTLFAAVNQTALFAQPAQEAARELVLTVGKSLLVNSAAPIERVAVGYGDIAEARVVDPRQVLINARASGETSLIVWQQGGNTLFFDVIVRPNTSNITQNLQNLRQQLQQEFPGNSINVSFENGTVFLRGTVKNTVSVDRAVAIASTFGKVVNLLYVDVPPTETQVLIKVQFATVDRSATTDLGMTLFSTGAANTIGRTTTGQFPSGTVSAPGPGQPVTATISDALNIFLFRQDLNLGTVIRALETRGEAEILAEPNVLAINGKPADFLAGGEFPYPILQGGGAGLGAVTVAFREFGVRINFLPLVTSRGTIRLDVAPEVSALDYTAGLTIQGFTIPGLTTRRVQTEIELQSGQSFAIGGLLDRRLTQTFQKIPLLADIPVLGKIFQSKSLQKQNNELLVIITPEIVHPIPEGQPKPQLDLLPYPLLGADNVPRTPGAALTGSAPAPTGEPIPFEQLMREQKAQEDMKLQQQSPDLSNFPGAQPMANPLPLPPGAPAAAPAPALAPAPAATPPK